MIDKNDSVSKSFAMMENAMEKAWEMWKVGLTSFAAAQEQIENITRKQLEQNNAWIGELVKMDSEVQKQVRRNQEQLQNMVELAVTKTLAQVDQANKDMGEALVRQVDFLIQQTRQNQDQMQRMVKETVLDAYLAGEKKQYEAIAKLTNQVEDMMKKMINLSSQVQEINKKALNK